MRPSTLITRVLARLEGRTTLKRLLANSGWLLFDKVLRMGLGIFIGIWMARYLGVTSFGQLNYAIAFVALFSTFASLGLDGIVVRELVRRPDQAGEILGSALLLKLAGGACAVLLAITGILLVRPAEPLFLWLVTIIATGLLFQCTDVFDLWFQSQVRSKYPVIARSTAFLAISAVKILLILHGSEVLAFAWAGLAEVLLGATGLVLLYGIAGQRGFRFSVSRATLHRLLSESWPLILSGLAIMLYMRIDQVMLGEISGSAEVGLYSAALRLSEAWYVIPAVVISSVLPNLTEVRGRSEALYYERIQRLFSLLARLAYLVAVPMTLFATPLVTLLFGSDYAAAGPILAVHIWTALFVFLGVGMSPWILNESLTRFSLFQTSLGAGINITLNSLLIPLHGGLGAAISTLVSQAVATYLALACFSHTRAIFRIETRALLLR